MIFFSVQISPLLIAFGVQSNKSRQLFLNQSNEMQSYNIYFTEMGSLLFFLLVFIIIERLNSTTFVNSKCEFSFTDQPCLFTFCRTTEHINLSSPNASQTTYFLWEECIQLCCPVGTSLTADKTVDYLTNKCRSTQDESLMPMIVGFSIGVPIVITILIIIYCKPWKHCITTDPILDLAQTRGEAGREKRKSVVLESSSYLFERERKSTATINFQSNYQKSDEVVACSICLEPDTSVMTQCGHQFHLNCLAEWLKKTQSCPDCRNSNLHKFQILCSRCYRLSRVLGTLDMDPSYTCKWCKILPN